MGHIGLTPQSYLNLGLKKQGESLESQEKIKKEASILEKLGCFSIVLEHIPDLLAKEIQNNLTIPTIGIGAGNYCDGQVRVTADLLGLNDNQPLYNYSDNKESGASIPEFLRLRQNKKDMG